MVSSLSSEEMNAQRSDFGLRLSNSMAKYGPLCVGIDPHRQLLADWGYKCGRLRCGTVLHAYVAGSQWESGSRQIPVLHVRALRFERYRGARTGTVCGPSDGNHHDAYFKPASPLLADAITLLPYYGARSLGGVINDALNNGRGVFIASLTSNQEGASLQTAIRQAGEYKGRTVAYGIASTAQKFNKGNDGMGSVGLIIGATIGQWINDSGVDPAKFTGPILSPGYGWQGAETRDLKTVFKGTKGNVLVTVSRFIAAHGPDIAALSAATESVALDIRQALIEAQNEIDDEVLDDDEEE